MIIYVILLKIIIINIILVYIIQLINSFSYGDHCKHIYIDLGCNKGVQIRKLYEPNKFDKNIAHIMKIFDETFGKYDEILNNRRDICTFSFEPNPLHILTLKELEAVYNSIGIRYKHFQYAVSTTNTTLKLIRQNNPYDFAAVLIKNKTLFETSNGKNNKIIINNNNTINVKVINFLEFLTNHILNRILNNNELNGKILIKMDIEGEEYNLLPSLITSGLACKLIDNIIIEYHIRQSKRFMKDAINEFNVSHAINLMEAMPLLLKLSKYNNICKTQLNKYDDESYQKINFFNKQLPQFPNAPNKCYYKGNNNKNNLKQYLSLDCILTKPPKYMNEYDFIQYILLGKQYTGENPYENE